MIHEDIYGLLANDAGVTAVTTKIWPVAGPQNTTFPAIVYSRINSIRDQNFDEVENFVRSTFMVDSYAKTYTAALSLSELVKAVLNNYRGGSIHKIKLDSSTDIVESETDLFRVSQNFEVWHTEQ